MTEEVLKIAPPLYFENSKRYSSNVPKQLSEGIKELSSAGKSYKTKYKLNRKLKKKGSKSSSVTDLDWRDAGQRSIALCNSAKNTSGLSEKD